MNTNDVIILARKHVGNGGAMDSSARLCLTDAIGLYEAGEYDRAWARAVDSLRYSVGILHDDFAKAMRHTIRKYSFA